MADIRHIVCYAATDAECDAIGAPYGEEWPAIVVKGGTTPNLCVFRSDGTTLAKTSVSEGTAKGTWRYVL